MLVSSLKISTYLHFKIKASHKKKRCFDLIWFWDHFQGKKSYFCIVFDFFFWGGGGTFWEFPSKYHKVQGKGQTCKLMLKCYVFIIMLGLTVKLQSMVILLSILLISILIQNTNGICIDIHHWIPSIIAFFHKTIIWTSLLHKGGGGERGYYTKFQMGKLHLKVHHLLLFCIHLCHFNRKGTSFVGLYWNLVLMTFNTVETENKFDYNWEKHGMSKLLNRR